VSNESIKIDTHVWGDGKIVQEVSMAGVNESYMDTIMRSVMDTKEQQVKDALIKLGWTPPEGT